MHGLIDDEMALIIPNIVPTKWRRFQSRILQSKHQNIDELGKDIVCQVLKKITTPPFFNAIFETTDIANCRSC